MSNEQDKLSSLIVDIYKSRKHLLEMLEDRGYNVEHLNNYTSEEISIMAREHLNNKFHMSEEIGPLDILLEKKNSSSLTEKIYVKYKLENKFKGTTQIKEQIVNIYDKYITKKDTLVIINNNKLLMSVGAKYKPEEDFVNDLYTTKNYFIQVFGIENFKFNISHHNTVPKHRVLSNEEAKNIKNCNVKQLPTIKRDDPMAKYIGLRLNQVCEITRNNITTGSSILYRICEH